METVNLKTLKQGKTFKTSINGLEWIKGRYIEEQGKYECYLSYGKEGIRYLEDREVLIENKTHCIMETKTNQARTKKEITARKFLRGMRECYNSMVKFEQEHSIAFTELRIELNEQMRFIRKYIDIIDKQNEDVHRSI